MDNQMSYEDLLHQHVQNNLVGGGFVSPLIPMPNQQEIPNFGAVAPPQSAPPPPPQQGGGKDGIGLKDILSIAAFFL